jgi:hypothetical protein
MVVKGKAYTRRELHHEDEFVSGGFIFQYQIGKEDGIKSGSKGVNILDGKL